MNGAQAGARIKEIDSKIRHLNSEIAEMSESPVFDLDTRLGRMYRAEVVAREDEVRGLAAERRKLASTVKKLDIAAP